MPGLNINPKTLIAIDVNGAMYTGFLTFVLLALEVINTGLPPNLLFVMAMVAYLYGIFGGVNQMLRIEVSKILRRLAFLNVLYGIAALTICIIHFRQTTLLGWLYFSIESTVLFALAILEWRAAARSEQ